MCCSLLRKKPKKKATHSLPRDHHHHHHHHHPHSNHGLAFAQQDSSTSSGLSFRSAPISSDSSSLSSSSLASFRSLLPEGPSIYRYEEIALATGNFDPGKKIGNSVWKTSLRHTTVAISKKQAPCWNTTHANTSRPRRLSSIVRSLHSLHHSSLVKLLGACHEGEFLYLVYEFLESSNLDDALRSKFSMGYTALPTWLSRLKIAIDVGKGLEYLHHHCNPSIVHKYLDSRHVLVTNDKMRAKIAYVGMSALMGEVDILDPKAKVENVTLSDSVPSSQDISSEIVACSLGEISNGIGHGETSLEPIVSSEKMRNGAIVPESNLPRKISKSRSIKINGFRGYMPPEYTMGGEVTSKYDVYAFGILLAELMSVKERELHKKKLPIPEMLNSIMTDDDQKGRLRVWMDPLLRDSFPIDDALKVASIARSCLDPKPEKRPDMSEVASNLQKYLASAEKWQANIDAQRELITTSLKPR